MSDLLCTCHRDLFVSLVKHDFTHVSRFQAPQAPHQLPVKRTVGAEFQPVTVTAGSMAWRFRTNHRLLGTTCAGCDPGPSTTSNNGGGSLVYLSHLYSRWLPVTDMGNTFPFCRCESSPFGGRCVQESSVRRHGRLSTTAPHLCALTRVLLARYVQPRQAGSVLAVNIHFHQHLRAVVRLPEAIVNGCCLFIYSLSVMTDF